MKVASETSNLGPYGFFAPLFGQSSDLWDIPNVVTNYFQSYLQKPPEKSALMHVKAIEMLLISRHGA